MNFRQKLRYWVRARPCLVCERQLRWIWPKYRTINRLCPACRELTLGRLIQDRLPMCAGCGERHL